MLLLMLLVASVVAATPTPAHAEDPVCEFVVAQECAPLFRACAESVTRTLESPGVQAAETKACEAKYDACVERTRRPAADCAALPAMAERFEAARRTRGLP